MKQKLYLMQNAFNLYKIGISVNPRKRASDISKSSGVVTDLLSSWDSENAALLEKFLHTHFSVKRKSGEWFELDDNDIWSIDGLIDNFDYSNPEQLAVKPWHIIEKEFNTDTFEDDFYKYPRMLMIADSYISIKTGEIVPLGEIEKNVYVVMKARNEYFDNHYDKQVDIAAMCNISLRKAASVIREFMNHGIIEASKVYSGGEHKNLKYSKVNCLELLKRLTESDRKGKIISTELKPLGKLRESLWIEVKKKTNVHVAQQIDNFEDRIPF